MAMTDQALHDAGWFRRVGLPLDDAERAEIAAIVHEPGSPRNIEILAAGSWPEAAGNLAAEDRDNRRWDAAEGERERLWEMLTDRFTEDELIGRIDAVRAEWKAVAEHAADAAAQRLRIGDLQFAAEAAGALQLALHHGALATLAGESSSHPFHRTLRWFAHGRWPLAFDQQRLILF